MRDGVAGEYLEVMRLKILVACEESQAVTKELRRLGHEAYSCDIEPCSGGHPEWHIQGDVLPILGGWTCIKTADDTHHEIHGRWDMIIAFPPCTHLSNAGVAHRRKKAEDGRLRDGIDFFMRFATADCEKIVVENPVGIISSYWRKPDQIIEPYQFGEPVSKRTCLWVKGLPLLEPTSIVEVEHTMFYKTRKKKGKPVCWVDQFPPGANRAKLRSKTFLGIARAMANTWGGDIRDEFTDGVSTWR